LKKSAAHSGGLAAFQLGSGRSGDDAATSRRSRPRVLPGGDSGGSCHQELYSIVPRLLMKGRSCLDPGQAPSEKGPLNQLLALPEQLGTPRAQKVRQI